MPSSYAGGPSSSGASPVSPVDSGRASATNPKLRKRTKTGCLTCRKRRIKCGEERPTCGNCVRSKRQCEGYNQRVVFKPPIGDWPNHPGLVSTMQYHNSLLPGTRTAYRPSQPAPSSPGVPSSAAPQREAAQLVFSHVKPGAGPPPLEQLNTQQPSMGAPPAYLNDPNYQQPLQSPHHHQPRQSPQSQGPTPTSAISYFPSQTPPAHANYQASYEHTAPSGYEAQQRYPQAGQYQQAPIPYNPHNDSKPALSQPHPDQSIYQHTQQPFGTSAESPYPPPSSRADGYATYPEQSPSLSRYDSIARGRSHVDSSQGGQYAAFPAPTNVHSPHPQFPQHHVDTDVKFLPQHSPALEQPIAVSKAQEQFQPQTLLRGFGHDGHISPTQLLDEAAVEYHDDDYYDVQSDEEMLDEQEDNEEGPKAKHRDFSLIRRVHRESTNDLDVRRYDAFIYEGILTAYRPEQVANPLKNPRTARVFLHFIHVSGPTLSIFERNPRCHSSSIYDHIPPSQQSLWTHTLPMKALNHQALLHAMLALASVNIAKLQNASITPSYKHYAYSLKRLGRALDNPKKRLQISTLATSLLLAFYEVMTAEHSKWSTHLVGLAQLLSELDFRSLTQEARRLKAVQAAQDEQFAYQNPGMLIDGKQLEQSLAGRTMMPDEILVGTIVGQKINYDDFGKVINGSPTQEKRNDTTEKLDLQSYETLQDLYWGYARQDSHQSMISGNPLITDYRKWSDCPPRSPLGRADALYGTHDHIILLTGRIADFIVRDRERKVKQIEANGGQWRPTPGMPGMPAGMAPPPARGAAQSNEPPTPTTPLGPPPHMHGMRPPTGPGSAPPGPPPTQTQPRGPPQTAGPGFYGMAPSQPTSSLPSSYANPNGHHNPHDASTIPNAPRAQFKDLPLAYQAALTEWNSISHAHAAIASILSNTRTFAPLSPDLYPQVPGNSSMTPFGPALLHRSYDISIIWSMLHLAQILLLRAHPAMPPAAMVAAAVCAPATQPYAILIGRIAAGLPLPPLSSADSPGSSSLTPALGAALTESAVSLFFAGAQYQDPAQREWLIERLLEIDRRTGWASAGVIARSCETGWEKAGEAGRGPPYKRRTTRRFGEAQGATAKGLETAERSAGARPGGDDRSPRPIKRSGDGEYGRREALPEPGRDGKKNNHPNPYALSQAGSWDEPERRFVVRHRAGFVPWAMNVLADEEDLRVGMESVGLDGDEGQGEGGGTEQRRVAEKGKD